MSTKPAISFEVLAREGEARAGVLTTRRGVIETPVFMPVGTAGTVKGVRFEALEGEVDTRIILGNTYHLWLRPGLDVIRACGGLHRFIGWRRALLTDSGGFQVWSLGALRKITEEGTEFRSHVDGSLKFLSPEISMEVQAALGSDIVMAFDECAAGDAPPDVSRKSMELTARWAKRSRVRFDGLQSEELDTGRTEGTDLLSGAQALFGIVQGGAHKDLRRESLTRTVEIGFDGYAIGGLSVGEEKSVMWDVVSALAPEMPAHGPRYLMGVGTPRDLIRFVAMGYDLFDCVLPTRNGRNGTLFTRQGKLMIRNAAHARDPRPVEDDCACDACTRFSRGALRHLVMAGEMLGAQLGTLHNLHFYLHLMREIRAGLAEGRFPERAAAAAGAWA